MMTVIILISRTLHECHRKRPALKRPFTHLGTQDASFSSHQPTKVYISPSTYAPPRQALEPTLGERSAAVVGIQIIRLVHKVGSFYRVITVAGWVLSSDA